MKLKDYLEGLVALVEERPETLEFDVVYSIDDEGNAFREIYWGPSVGKFDAPDFESEANMAENSKDFPEEYKDEDMTPNSICIN
jgi:hypothetical protein